MSQPRIEPRPHHLLMEIRQRKKLSHDPFVEKGQDSPRDRHRVANRARGLALAVATKKRRQGATPAFRVNSGSVEGATRPTITPMAEHRRITDEVRQPPVPLVEHGECLQEVDAQLVLLEGRRNHLIVAPELGIEEQLDLLPDAAPVVEQLHSSESKDLRRLVATRLHVDNHLSLSEHQGKMAQRPQKPTIRSERRTSSAETGDTIRSARSHDRTDRTERYRTAVKKTQHTKQAQGSTHQESATLGERTDDLSVQQTTHRVRTLRETSSWDQSNLRTSNIYNKQRIERRHTRTCRYQIISALT